MYLVRPLTLAHAHGDSVCINNNNKVIITRTGIHARVYIQIVMAKKIQFVRTQFTLGGWFVSWILKAFNV